MHRALHLRIAPVEIGLLSEKRVIVILTGFFVPRPGAAAEICPPIVRRPTAWIRIAPDIPIPALARARRARIDKPGMTIGSMIRDIVEQELHATAMDIVQQGVEFRHGAEDRVDIGIVADIVAEIRHRRRIDRRNPDGIDAQPLKIIELLTNATEVTDAIAVAVHEGARIDLVNNTPLPPTKIISPGRLAHCCCQC